MLSVLYWKKVKARTERAREPTSTNRQPHDGGGCCCDVTTGTTTGSSTTSRRSSLTTTITGTSRRSSSANGVLRLGPARAAAAAAAAAADNAAAAADNAAAASHRSAALTLPAAAVSWLGRTLLVNHPDDFDDDDAASSPSLSGDNHPTFLLQLLLHRATHLRITTDPWPPSKKKKKRRGLLLSRRRRASDFETTTTPEQQLTPPINRTVIDLSLFPNLRVLWLDRVPVEWIQRRQQPPHLQLQQLWVLRIERACIYNLAALPFLDASLDALTHVKFSHCCLGEQSGLRGFHPRTAKRRKSQSKRRCTTNQEEREDDNNDPGKIDSVLNEQTHTQEEDDDGDRKPAAVDNNNNSNTPQPLLPPMARLSRSIQSLCLSHNELQTAPTALAGLEHLPALRQLDLSHNLLPNLARAHWHLGNLEVLDLSHNRMATVAGLDRLVSLRTLRLDGNLLRDLHTVASRLASLPLLAELHLQGNPLQFVSKPQRHAEDNNHRDNNNGISLIKRSLQQPRIHPDYRATVLNAFRERRFAALEPPELAALTLRAVQALLPALDGTPATTEELRQLRRQTFVPVVPPVLDAVAAAARQFGGVGKAVSTQSVVRDDDEEEALLQQQQLVVPEPTLRSCAYASGRVHRCKPRRRQKVVTVRNGGGNHDDDDDVAVVAIRKSPTTTPLAAFTVTDVVESMQKEELSDSNLLRRDGSTAVVKSTSFQTPDGERYADREGIDSLEENIGMLYIERISKNRPCVWDLPDTTKQSVNVRGEIPPTPPSAFDQAVSSSVNEMDTSLASPALGEPSVSGVDQRDFSEAKEQSPLRPKMVEAKSIEMGDTLDDQLLAQKVQKAIDDGANDEDIANLLQSKMQQDNAVTPDMKASVDSTAATTMDTHMMSGASTPLRSVSPVAETPASVTPAKTPLKNVIRSNGSSNSPSTESGTSANTPQASPRNKLNIRITSLSDSQWRDETMSIASSTTETPHKATESVKGLSRTEAFRLAEQKSAYTGPNTYRKMLIRENLELYFRLFVFSAAAFSKLPLECTEEDEPWLAILQQYPRIQLWPVDRSKREQAYRRDHKGQLLLGKFLDTNSAPTVEEFRRVWCEKVVACGKSALQRLTPCRDARFGFHGELLWSAAESSHMKPEVVVDPRDAICCLSDRAFYILSDHDAVTEKAKEMKKAFPLPIPKDASFAAAKWPHAMACHPFDTLRRITIGFGFQRLTLHFVDEPLPSSSASATSSTSRSSSTSAFTYILLTSNKLETVDLLKELQELTQEVSDPIMFGSPSAEALSAVQIENDDRHVLDALSRAVQPEALGMVLHYQILQQRWKRGSRGTVRRVCVVTDTKLFLLDEDYTGDGSDALVDENSDSNVAAAAASTVVGASINRLVDSADLTQVVEVQAASVDPKAITIVIKPSRLKKSHNWRLLCRDGQGAERLVYDVRKAISMGNNSL